MADVKISAEEFKKLYFEMTVKALAKQLKVTEHQVVKAAKQLGISKPRGIKANKLIIEG